MYVRECSCKILVEVRIVVAGILFFKFRELSNAVGLYTASHFCGGLLPGGKLVDGRKILWFLRMS